MILKACLNGSRLPGEHPGIPTTPESLAFAAAEAQRAGADAIHPHAKDATGVDTLAAQPLADVLAAVRAAGVTVPLGATTGAWASPSTDERVREIRRWRELPDFASVNWHEDGAEQVAKVLLELGVGVEAGLWNLEAVTRWARSPFRSSCLRVLIELPPGPDRTTTARLADAMIKAVSRENRAHLPVLLHGEDSSAWDALTLAACYGLSTRVGFEDTLRLPDGALAPNNPALIEAAKKIIGNA